MYERSPLRVHTKEKLPMRNPDGFIPFWLHRLHHQQAVRAKRELLLAMGFTPAEDLMRPRAPVLQLIEEPPMDRANAAAMGSTRIFPRSIAGEHEGA
jgi:hypothetical protein